MATDVVVGGRWKDTAGRQVDAAVGGRSAAVGLWVRGSWKTHETLRPQPRLY